VQHSEEQKDRFIITHSDLDMAGCLIVLEYLDIPYDRVSITNYSDYEDGGFDYDKIGEYKEIWYADFSPDVKSLQIIKKNNIKCKIFDHHIAQFDVLTEADKDNDNLEYHFNNEKSGTEILFDYLKQNKRLPKAIKEFVILVSTYDLWKENDPLFEKASDLNRVFWKNLDFRMDGYYKYFPFIEKMIKRLFTFKDHFRFTRLEQIGIKETRQQEKKLAQKAMDSMLVRTDCKGYKFGITKAKKKISIIAHKILLAKRELSYIIIINEWDKHLPKLSLRSKGFNLLDLNYTSGHENACGCKNLDKEYIDGLWRGSHYEIGYEEIDKAFNEVVNSNIDSIKKDYP
jgi:hypothetical protein